MSQIQEGAAGWTSRGLAAVAFAALSAVFVFFFLFEDREAAAGADGLIAFVTGTMLGHALGGFIAGWLLAGMFGRHGVAGWVVALIGGLLVALLSGALGGFVNSVPALLEGASLVGEFIRIGSSAVVTPLAIAAAPWLGGIWLVAIAAIHFAVKSLRE